MDKIRILYIIGSYGVGGKERQLAELIKGLPKNRYSVSFIVKNADAHYLENIENNIDFFYSLEEKRFGLRALLRVYKKIKDFKPDIVHSWASVATLQLIIIRVFLNFKLIDSSIRDSNKPDFLARIIIRIINLYSDKIIANSKAGLLCYMIPERKSTFIHNGFDFNRISNLEPVESIRSKFNILSPKVVGMVARIDKAKDYPAFIQSAYLLLDQRRDIQFTIVGDGEDKEKIQSMIIPAYKDNFVFTGRQSNIESIINCFDIAVLSTFTEGISNSVMEYMGLGKPVIATDGGGTSEIVKDGVTGFLVRKGDEKQLAEKILLLLNNPDLGRRMGVEGKRRVVENFSFEKMVSSYIAEYEQILKT